MRQLGSIDTIILTVYILGMVVLGAWLARRSKTVEQFTAAGGRIPGWAVGLSIFGSYLSSITFLGLPGKAFGGNWNAFVFSLTLPIAAMVASRYFIPFYRRSGDVSAYTHLEARFGPWARTYTMLCYLLMQVGRIGAVLFGVALVLNTLLGWDMRVVIAITGALVVFYTLLGGIEAVVWTDVVQSIILMLGAVVTLGILVWDMPEGAGQILQIAQDHDKLSLGSFGPSLVESTVWVVLMYGICVNLTNFGIDQDIVQRYHVAKSERDARRAAWGLAWLYIPVSFVFLLIGTSLFAFYEVNPDLLNDLKHQVAATQLKLDPDGPQGAAIDEAAAGLTAADIGDKALPHFIVNKLPTGFVGLLIAALVAAAMSSIDTSLNCSATIMLKDFYGRYIDREISERNAMRVLRGTTILWGVIGTTIAMLLINTRSLLDTWWTISGIFAGGMLGLFLLGFVAKRATNASGALGVLIGFLVIAWMTISSGDYWPASWASLKSPFHANMITVIGTLTIFLVGVLVSQISTRDSR